MPYVTGSPRSIALPLAVAPALPAAAPWMPKTKCAIVAIVLARGPGTPHTSPPPPRHVSPVSRLRCQGAGQPLPSFHSRRYLSSLPPAGHVWGWTETLLGLFPHPLPPVMVAQHFARQLWFELYASQKGWLPCYEPEETLQRVTYVVHACSQVWWGGDTCGSGHAWGLRGATAGYMGSDVAQVYTAMGLLLERPNGTTRTQIWLFFSPCLEESKSFFLGVE